MVEPGGQDTFDAAVAWVHADGGQFLELTFPVGIAATNAAVTDAALACLTFSSRVADTDAGA